MTSTFELDYTARRLRKQIDRAHKLTERLTEQAADRTLDLVDRESAAHRAKMSIETSQALEESLERVEEALRWMSCRIDSQPNHWFQCALGTKGCPIIHADRTPHCIACAYGACSLHSEPVVEQTTAQWKSDPRNPTSNPKDTSTQSR